VDPDPDPAILVIDLQDANKKIIRKGFSAYYLLKVHLYHFSKIKCPDLGGSKRCGSGGSTFGSGSRTFLYTHKKFCFHTKNMFTYLRRYKTFWKGRKPGFFVLILVASGSTAL
jgi:hypothetical protein